MKQHINDISIAFSKAGQGDNVVMLHGLAEDRHSFAEFQAQLQDFCTFAWDMRRHGETEPGNADGTLAQLGNDLIGFLESVTGPATCIGYSIGGTIVLWVTAIRPDLVPHAIVIGTSTKVGHTACEFFKERVRLIENDWPAFEKALYQDTAAQIFDKNIDIDAVTQQRLRAVGPGQGYINAARAMIEMHRHPITPLLEKIDTPVDVIGGEEDLFCPRKASDILIEGLKNSRYREIPKAGHLMRIDQPALYYQTLKQALLNRSGAQHD